MFHDLKPTTMSPSKGKAKEKRRWQYNWWDFQLLAERTQRPLEWSQSALMFTVHPTQPLVTARHFLSSKQFVLPSPAPLLNSPASYDPPTVISACPGDEWLFAYFPGQKDGTACLWRRGTQIDDWNVKEWWSCAKGAGVVAASWLGTPREWVTDPFSALSLCLPPRGPSTPISGPTLLLVTQNHMVNMCYYRHYIPSLQIIRCSLDKPGIALEGRNQLHENTETTKQCFRASIGLNYNDTSILIATRSYLSPPPSGNDSQMANLDTALLGELEHPVTEYDSYREESAINITEVQLRFNGIFMSITTEALPPISNAASLSSLNFIIVASQSSVSSDPNKSLSLQKHDKERGPHYLVSTYLEFGDYTSTPKSTLVVHKITRQGPTSNTISNRSAWICHELASRSFGSQVLAFVAPCSLISTPTLLYAGIVEASGALPRSLSRLKEITTGEIRVLQLFDLTDSGAWDTIPIMSPIDRIGQSIPLRAVVSPNGVLLSMLSSSLFPVRTSVQLLPRPKHALDSGKHNFSLAARLSSAILSRRSTADIAHILSLPTTPIIDVFTIMYQTAQVLKSHQGELSESLTHAILGEAMAVYRKRALGIIQDKGDKEVLEMRWKTAHDICSLIACNLAFEDSKEGETYNLDAVWQLIALASWVVAFTERLMKECVLFSLEVQAEPIGSPPTLDKSFTSPLLLHLSHPFALQKLAAMLTHVKQYRAYLGSLSAKGQNAQIARDILIDVVDNSGIDFAALESLLTTSLGEAKTLDSNDCLRALAICQPTPAMRLFLAKVILQSTQSTVLHKPMLFIKPLDLMDDVEGFPASSKKNKDRDVVLKRVLAGGQVPSLTCLRCGGQSEVRGDINAEHISPRWRAWEQMWITRCICGGTWTRTDNS